MILARNLQQPLNGNSVVGLLLVVLSLLACSPKVVKQEKTATPIVITPPKAVERPVTQFTQAKLSVLIPFEVGEYDLNTLTRSQVKKTDMAIDFYQGLLLGIDKASESGLNFKLNVFDTRDDSDRATALGNKEALIQSDLIIGPVFPSQIKAMTPFAVANDKPIVSPLAASKPSDFNIPTLISVVNDITVHSENIAKYIGAHYKATESVVVLINTKSTNDEDFAAPIRAYLAKHSPKLLVQEFSSVQVLETKMMRNRKYAVVLCSDDSRFVTPSLTKLFRLKNLKTGGFPIQLFGYPSWSKQNFSVDQLQGLNTIISSSYYVDYQDVQVKSFLKIFRDKYKLEPSEYAFKGYDVGFYFGSLISKHGKRFLDFVLKEGYNGLQNKYDFGFSPETGYYNRHVYLMQYRNMSLRPIND